MRDKKTIRELQEMLAEATELVRPGSTWRHYKGGVYVVSCLAFNEETLDIKVIYQPVEAPEIFFTRQLVVWLESVEWEGATLPRFEHIAD
ncbi:MAG: DUF1653 domain-containing protein [Candidatus Saccharimonadales bacterium]